MKTLFFSIILSVVAISVNAKVYTRTVENEKDLKAAKIELANKYFAESGKYEFKMITVKKNGKYIITIKIDDNDK